MLHAGGIGVLSLTLVGVAAPVRPPPAPVPLAAAASAGVGAARERERDQEPERSATGAWDLVAADMNGDRRLDLVVASGGPGDPRGVIEIWLNPGARAPLEAWQRVALAARGDYGRLAVGDIDGDGDNDIAALTFGSRQLRWWLLAPDLSVEDERSMAFGGPDPGSCPGPDAGGAALQTLSSLAFADLDGDRALELAVTSYASGDSGRAFLFSFERGLGCFVSRPGFPQVTAGSLRVRFIDVDGDGALDLVASHYALGGGASSGGAPAVGGLEWGSWWRGAAGRPRPLRARFASDLLEAAPTPELNVVDFDAVLTGEGLRFALAASAHLCPAADCWTVGAAGFVSVIDAEGQELYDAGEWKRRAELAPAAPGARLLPRSVAFVTADDRASLVAGYWWGTRQRSSPCNRLEPCPGPVVAREIGAASGDERREQTVEPAAFMQALALVDAPDDALELRERCSRPAASLPLPEGIVTGVESVALSGRLLPKSAYSWVPGNPGIRLAAPFAASDGEACVTAAAARRAWLAVADAASGLRLSSL